MDKEFELDNSITGRIAIKNVLNKKKLSKEELDSIFNPLGGE